jgi:hypothetical protein
VFFDVLHTDITTAHLFAQLPGHMKKLDNIKDAIRQEVIDHIQNESYRWSDLAQVLHIMDTDGAFIDDSCVMKDDATELTYRKDCIVARNPEFIKYRNHEKRKRMKELCAMHHLTYQTREIPYQAYYMSRNLDHALHNISEDLSQEDKSQYARTFRSRYKDDIPGFLALINDTSLAVEGDYRQTWNYIAQGLHSLERNSNIHLALTERYASASDIG